MKKNALAAADKLAAAGRGKKSGIQALPGSAAATGQRIQSAFSGLGSRFGFKKRSRKNRHVGIVKRTRKNRR